MSKLIKKKSGGSALAAAVQKDAQRVAAGAMELQEALVLLLDVSPSMDDLMGGQTRYRAMLEAASALVEASHPLAAVGLELFSDAVHSQHGVLPSVRRTAIRERLARLSERPQGSGTSFAPVLDCGLAVVTPMPVTLRRLVLLSDGDDNASFSYFRERMAPAWRAAAERCAAQRVIVDTVFIGDHHERGSGATTLAEIARITGGVAMTASDARALKRVFLALEARERGLLPRGA